MLMQLLALIGRGRLQRPADLAVELGVSPALLEQMLADLERMGYLARVGGGCAPAACDHCASACLRPGGGQPAGWLLTARGQRYLENQHAY